jgi:hypothetical protein
MCDTIATSDVPQCSREQSLTTLTSQLKVALSRRFRSRAMFGVQPALPKERSLGSVSSNWNPVLPPTFLVF